MKRICFSILILICTFLLTACGREKRLRGEVTQYDGKTLSIVTEDGGKCQFVLTENTHVFSWVDFCTP